jgi:hypothetical protein
MVDEREGTARVLEVASLGRGRSRRGAVVRERGRGRWLRGLDERSS